MDILKLAAKFLPKDKQEALAKALPLLKEKAVKADLNLVLNELQKEISAINKDPAPSKDLKSAFNKAAELVVVGKEYLKNDGVSIFTVGKLASNQSAYRESGKTLYKAFRENAPGTKNFTNAVKANKTIYDAVTRLILKTDGRIFRLEANNDGSGKAVELLTGNLLSVHIKTADFQEITRVMQASKKSPPTPPAA